MRYRRIFAGALSAALSAILLAPFADALTLRFAITRSVDGVFHTSNPNGDYFHPSFLSCNDTGAPSLENLEVGSPYSANVLQYFSGSLVNQATFSVETVSGEDATAEGWGITSTNLVNVGQQLGSGSLRIVGRIGTTDVPCSTRPWSYIQDALTDEHAPATVTGVTRTAGPEEGQVTISFDQAGDLRVGGGGNPSGLVSYDLIHATGTTSVTAGVLPGEGPNWLENCYEVNDITPNPTANQLEDDSQITLTSAGAGMGGNNDGYYYCAIPHSGGFRLTGKLNSMTGLNATFANFGLTYSALNPDPASGGADGAQRVSSYWQEAGTGFNPVFQTKARLSSQGLATNISSSDTAPSPNGACIQIARAEGSNVIESRYSLNCIDWIDHNPVTMTIPDTYYLGIHITSNGGAPVTGIFDWVSLQGYPRLTEILTTDDGSLDIVSIDAEGNMSTLADIPYTTEASGPAMRWNPGHYMLLGYGETRPGTSADAVKNRITYFSQFSFIEGVIIRYEWKWMELAPDTYQWAIVQDILNHAATVRPGGMSVGLMLYDKNFNNGGDITRCPAPDYVKDTIWDDTDAPNAGCAVYTNQNGGTMARIWRADVMDRLIAFEHKLCEQFEDNPYFEGVFGTESTASFGGTTPPDDYSNSKYWTQLIRRVYEGAPGCTERGIPYWVGLNMPTGTTTAVTDFHKAMVQAIDSIPGAGITGPDICPTNGNCPADGGVNGQRAYLGINPLFGGVDYRDRYPASWNVQEAGFDPPLTLSVGYDFMYNTLRQGHMIWAYTNSGGALSFVANLQPFLAAGRPVRDTCRSNWVTGCEGRP